MSLSSIDLTKDQFKHFCLDPKQYSRTKAL